MEIKEREQIVKSFRQVVRVCKKARMEDEKACYECPLFNACESLSQGLVSFAHFDGLI